MLRVFNYLGLRFGVNTAWNVLSFGLPVLVWCLGLALGAWLGWTLGRAPVQLQLEQARTERAELQAAQSETARLQALAAARGLQDAQARGNALSANLLGREAQIRTLTREKNDALKNLTTGRACLSGAAVRVLNGAAEPEPAGLELVPQTPGGAAATGGAFATDADVGHWAVAARADFETCRQRLDALIDWHTQGPTRDR
jgi:prophage endopeptidase